MRKKGSKVESSVHYTLTEVLLCKEFEMSKVVDAIFDVRKRLRWDKNIVTIRRFGRTANSWINYQHNKAPMGLEARDFVDKYVQFSTVEGRVYVYYSSIPESEKQFPIPPLTQRARTLIGIQRFERCPDTQRIRCVFLSQTDLKVKVDQNVLAKYLGPSMQVWVGKLNAFVKANLDTVDFVRR